MKGGRGKGGMGDVVCVIWDNGFDLGIIVSSGISLLWNSSQEPFAPPPWQVVAS